MSKRQLANWLIRFKDDRSGKRLICSLSKVMFSSEVFTSVLASVMLQEQRLNALLVSEPWVVFTSFFKGQRSSCRYLFSCSVLLSLECVKEPLKYFIVINRVVFLPEIEMNLLLKYEDALLSTLSLNLAVAFYSSCFHLSEEREAAGGARDPGDLGKEPFLLAWHVLCKICMCYDVICY